MRALVIRACMRGGGGIVTTCTVSTALFCFCFCCSQKGTYACTWLCKSPIVWPRLHSTKSRSPEGKRTAIEVTGCVRSTTIGCADAFVGAESCRLPTCFSGLLELSLRV